MRKAIQRDPRQTLPSLRIQANAQPSINSRGKRLALLILAALLVGLLGRFYLILNYVGDYDYYSFDIVAGIMLRGGNIYAETARYNYSPVWAYVLLGLTHVTTTFHVPYQVVIRTFLTTVDLAIAVLVGYIASVIVPGRGWLSFAAYWANPVTILLTGYHGQFENLAMLPLVGAVALVSRPKADTPETAIWALGTLALLVKQISVFAVWMLFVYTFRGRRSFLAMGLSGVVFLASFLPFLPGGLNGIIQNVLLYQSAVGVYGFGLLPRIVVWLANYLPHLSFDWPRLALEILKYLIVPFVAFMALLPYAARNKARKSLPEAMCLSAVGLLAAVYGFGEQYFSIPVIFGSYALSVPYALYTLVTGLMILNSPVNVALFGGWGLHPFIIVVNVVWLCTVGWFVFELRRSPVTASRQDTTAI